MGRQLSGQSGTTTLFMKVDVHNSNRKTVSFNTQDLICEQLDNLTPMVYNMSIQKEGYNSHLSPRHIKEKKRPELSKFSDRDRNRSFSRDRVNYRWHFGQNLRPSYKRQSQDRQDNRRGNYWCQNCGTWNENRDRIRDRVNIDWTLVMTEKEVEIEIGVQQEKDENN